MGHFLGKIGNNSNDRSVRITLPGIIPVGAEYNIFITNEAYETGTITISKDDEKVVEILKDGSIVVNGTTVA